MREASPTSSGCAWARSSRIPPRRGRRRALPPSDAADEGGRAVGGAGGGISASFWARRARRHVGADVLQAGRASGAAAPAPPPQPPTRRSGPGGGRQVLNATQGSTSCCASEGRRPRWRRRRLSIRKRRTASTATAGPAGGGGRGRGGAAGRHWACPACTFFNEPGARQCEMCGTRQPPSVAAAAPRPPRPPSPRPPRRPPPYRRRRRCRRRGGGGQRGGVAVGQVARGERVGVVGRRDDPDPLARAQRRRPPLNGRRRSPTSTSPTASAGGAADADARARASSASPTPTPTSRRARVGRLGVQWRCAHLLELPRVGQQLGALPLPPRQRRLGGDLRDHAARAAARRAPPLPARARADTISHDARPLHVRRLPPLDGPGCRMYVVPQLRLRPVRRLLPAAGQLVVEPLVRGDVDGGVGDVHAPRGDRFARAADAVGADVGGRSLDHAARSHVRRARRRRL